MDALPLCHLLDQLPLNTKVESLDANSCVAKDEAGENSEDHPRIEAEHLTALLAGVLEAEIDYRQEAQKAKGRRRIGHP